MDVLSRVKRLDAWVNHVDTTESSSDHDWFVPVAGCLLGLFVVVFCIVACYQKFGCCCGSRAPSHSTPRTAAVGNNSKREGLLSGFVYTEVTQDKNASPV